MRVTTKIILGFGILIVLMIGLVVFQVLRINRMQSIIRDLSEVNFEVSSRTVELEGTIIQVADFARKVVASTDPKYELGYMEWRDQAQQEIRDLARTANSETELEQIRRLVESWDAFLQYFEAYRASRPPEPPDDIPPEMEELLDRLSIQAESVYSASRSVIEREAERSMTTADQAKILSGIAASIALVLSLFVSFFVVQSISAPLKQLTQGTRAIAEGKFFYRLDTSHRDEFSHLAKDFNTMTERLNDLDRMKRDFVAHVSHELQSPLASMQETVQLLLERAPGELTPKQQRFLELNLQNGKRLASLIRNLLDMSRMEAGAMEYELKSNNLAALAKTAVDETEALAGEKQIRLLMEAPPQEVEGMCDGDRIIQVVKNLLSNAVKFSPARSEVEVRLRAVEEVPEGVPATRRDCLRKSNSAGYAMLEVIDSGTGVPDEHKERIFEKFHQVKQGTKIPGQGAGLGLAISRTIAEAHGGAIWVEDNSSGGSTFKVVFPLAGRSREMMRSELAPIG